MDRDGTHDGFDLELTRAVADAVGVPVIASGGVGTLEHLVEGVLEGGADAVLAASIFHFGEHTVAEAKAAMAAGGVVVRPSSERCRTPRQRLDQPVSTKATTRSATTAVRPTRKWSAIGHDLERGGRPARGALGRDGRRGELVVLGHEQQLGPGVGARPAASSRPRRSGGRDGEPRRRARGRRRRAPRAAPNE